jgi:hypothetical protein
LIRENGDVWTFILFENVDRHRFRMSSCSGGGIPRPDLEAALDRGDAWSVLRSLREEGRHPEMARSGWAAGSLDDVVSEDAAQTGKMSDLVKVRWASRGEAIVAPKEDEAERAQKHPPPMVIAAPSDGASMQTVWDYSAGNAWKWESKGLTQAGRQCDVLTFGGSEIVIPGRTALEIEKDSTKGGE